jgi:predicted nucleotidyltransferase
MRNPTLIGDRTRLKAIADRLRERYGAQRVILFGSTARGEATEHSDVDLLVISATAERYYERMASALALVRDLSHRMPLVPIVLTPEEFAARRDRGDQFITEIAQTGVDL